MSRPRRKPAPPGRVQILCTGRGTHDVVKIRTLQMIDAGTEVALRWNQREGKPPVTGFRDAEGRQTYELKCNRCRPGRHLKIREDKLGKAAMALAGFHGISGDDNTPVPVDISALEVAL